MIQLKCAMIAIAFLLAACFALIAAAQTLIMLVTLFLFKNINK